MLLIIFVSLIRLDLTLPNMENTLFKLKTFLLVVIGFQSCYCQTEKVLHLKDHEQKGILFE